MIFQSGRCDSPKRKSRNDNPGFSLQPVSVFERLSAFFSSSPLSSSSFSSWVSIFLLFSLARLSSSPLSWPASSPQALARPSEQSPLLRAPRRRSPTPLPRSRRSLPFRPPAPRRPAETPRCHPRNWPSLNPFHPPLDRKSTRLNSSHT